ncbi:MAG: ExeM/NucH family extracellular endonuclease [Actinomycetota bacterium]
MPVRVRLLIFAAMSLLLGLVAASPAEATVDPTAPVFINELHYDNVGTDTGEFVEVAGPAGTDLTGWSLVLYNGSGGASYRTDVLAGVISDQDDGFGTISVSYPVNGIQNGAPDGVALVDPGGNVVEFLSYEGTVNATDGPASGLTSTDIGVEEASSTPVGQSLAKTGTGTVAGDFTWQGPAGESPGAVNTGQDFGGGSTDPADPVINELGFSDASTDNEFVEVFGDPSANYSAFTILQLESDPGTANPGQIDHVVPIGTTGANGLFSTSVPSNSFENDSSTFLLVEGFTGADEDDLDTDDDGTLDVEPWSRIVDSVAVDDTGGLFYGTPVLDESFDDARLDNPFAPGGLSRIPDGADTDTAADWYRNDFSWDGVTNGSPEPGEALNTPGAPNEIVPIPGPDVLINEVDADQTSTDDAEFVELSDGGVGNTSLDGLVLVLFNGSGDASYNAFDLDGQSTGADGYFVLCGNAATTANCDLDVSPDTNLIQNGADAVALYQGDAADFPAGTAPTATGLVDALVYDTNDADDAGLLAVLNTAGGQVDEGANGDQTGHSNSRCPDSSGTPLDTSTYDAVTPTPGAANDCSGGPGPELRLISEIQGTGDASPFDGQPVVISGIVVGDFQEIVTNDPTDEPLDGFFVQEEDADADADPSTSEGIFVFAPGGAAVSVGDLVEVTGTVDEFFDLTEITNVTDITVVSSGNPLPTPATPTVPTSLGDAPVDWEAIEGMSVSFTQPLFVSGLFPLGSFGEIDLSAIGPWDHPNQVQAVGSQAAADVRALNLASRVVLDDGEDENESFPSGLSTWNPNPTPYLDGPEGTVRAGDVVNDLFGVVHFAFGDYEVQPVNLADATDPDGGVTITRTPRPTAVPDVGGDLTVASFNVLNYFTTIDNGQAICGPPSNLQRCRGADTQAEFDLQSTKIADAIADLDADIVGLIELENSGTDAAIADLVAKVNAVLAGQGSARTYDYVPTGFVGTDAIAVGYIYDPATVGLDGPFAVLDSSVSPAFIDTKNRPALAQTFTDLAGGANLTVAVNHLKSKGSACDDVANPGDPAFGVAPYALGDDLDVGPIGDPLFTGNCNLTRTAAAKVLGQWLAQDPTGASSDNLLVLGDLNAYANEDPITELEGQGYADLVEAANGGDTSWAIGGHSFVFNGEFGSLDYAMANDALAPQVTGADVWHINADEPFAIDYQNFNPPGQATPDEWKSSDHDPVLVGLSLTPTGPMCNGLPATIVGTDGNDRLVGTSGDDVIVGLGGNDTLIGLAGNDVLCGGDGNDLLYGGGGDDEMFGEGDNDRAQAGSGNDTFDGGDGNDYANGADGVDTLLGGPGRDRLLGGNDDDVIDGGDGNDLLRGGRGIDDLDGGGDDDDINGDQDDDVAVGGPGDDRVRGGAGNDVLGGGDGHDLVDGGSGNDTMTGDGDDDRMFGRAGDDNLDGGDGDDLLNGGNQTDTCTNGETLQNCEL